MKYFVRIAIYHGTYSEYEWHEIQKEDVQKWEDAEYKVAEREVSK